MKPSEIDSNSLVDDDDVAEGRALSILQGQARIMGVELDTPEARMLYCFTRAVLSENKIVNLTAIESLSEALRLHVIDSLAALPELSRALEGRGIDIGSGGGFPGVPLAIAANRGFVLLDSVEKKSAAVRRALGACGVAGPLLSVSTGRAETFSLHHNGEFVVVVARAVASLPSLVELAAPLLCDEGLLIALKGRLKNAERESGARAAAIVGMSELSVRFFHLPGGGEGRSLVTYVKDREANISLPRRIGLAQSRPLA